MTPSPTKQPDAWAAISLLRDDFERFKRDVSIGAILNDEEIAYWKAHTHAVEVLVTALRTHKGELPGRLKELAQAVADVPAPVCRPGDHVVPMRRPA